MRKSIIVLGIVVLASISNLFSQSSCYDDPIFIEWKEMFHKGEYQNLIESTEANLLSDNPHLIAADAWIVAQKCVGNELLNLEDIKPEIKDIVEAIIRLNKYHSEDRSWKVYNEFSENDIISFGNLYAVNKWVDMVREIDPIGAYQLSKKMIFELGEYYSLATAISLLAQLYEQVYQSMISDLKEGVYDSSPNIKSFLSSTFMHRPVYTIDELASTLNFLEKSSSDAIAWGKAGKWARGGEKYEEAIQYFGMSMQLDPFFNDGKDMLEKAESFVKLHRYNEATELARSYAQIYYPNDNLRVRLSEWGRILTETGDKGKAREFLDSAIALYPDDQQVNYYYGLLEKGSKRDRYAIPFFIKALKASPDNFNYYDLLISSYRFINEYEKALDLYQKVYSKYDVLNVSLYDEGYWIFTHYEEFEESESVLGEIGQHFNFSYWRRKRADLFIKQKKYDEALEVLNELYKTHPPYTSTIKSYAEACDSLYSNPEITTEILYELAEKYHWKYDIWDVIADRNKDPEAQIAIWDEALIKNPGRKFPLTNQRYIFSTLKQWDRYEKLLSENESLIMQMGNQYDKQGFFFEKGILTVLKLREQSISKEEFEKAQSYFNQYIENGGRDATYHQYVAELYESQREYEKAAEHTGMANFYRPDSYTHVSKLNRRYAKYYGYAEARKVAYDYFMRNPYDEYRMDKLIFLNSRWNGTSINTLHFVNIAKERFPDLKINDSEGMAYGQLGDDIRKFEKMYAKATVIGGSYRYVNWYKSSIQNVWDGSTRIEMDYNTNTATILYPDGTIAQRQDDLRYGKLKKIQVGENFIKADYDRNGNMILLESSFGQSFKMFYNEGHKTIKTIDSEGTTIKIGYNEKGKIEVFEVVGIGVLNLYDENGKEIINPNEEDENIMSVIRKSFEELNELKSLLTNASDNMKSNRLPDFAIKDTEYDQLMSKYDNSYNELEYGTLDLKSIKATLQASLELTDYMIEHLHTNSSFDNDANYYLTDAFGWIKSEIIEHPKDEELKAYALECVDQFYTLLFKIRKRGVDNETWQKWIEMRDWLNMELADESTLSDYRLEIEKMLTKFREQPVILLETSQWLPKSILNTDAYWTKYPYHEIIPEDIGDHIEINTILYRKNGDIILGTTRGLIVKSKGYWQWYGYDPVKRGFFTDVSSSKLKGSSNITALAEDNSNNMIIGTADGLIIHSEQFGKKADYRLTDFDGLKANRIHGLAIMGDSVLVATESTLQWYYSGNIYPENFIQDVRIRFIASFKSEAYDGWNSLDEYKHTILAGTNEGLYLIDDNNWFEKVSSSLADDVTIDENGIIYILYRNEISKLVPDFESEFSMYREYPVSGNVTATDANGIYGIEMLPINEYEMAPGVLTDMGISFYHDNYFEHFFLPLSDFSNSKAESATCIEKDFIVVSDKYLYQFSKSGEVSYPGTFHELLSVDQLNKTLVADGENLKYIDHRDPSSTLLSANDDVWYATTTNLAIDDKNRVIYNDGLQIKRGYFSLQPYTIVMEEFYDQEAEEYIMVESIYDEPTEQFISEDLFYGSQYKSEDGSFGSSGEVNQILVAGDGTIWVTAGASVFRYKEYDNTYDLQEFNFFRNPEIFPSKTNNIYNIIETNDEKIRAICSDEGHLTYNGLYLEGGLLEWQPDSGKFIRLETKNSGFNFFITSYTSIDVNKAIFGTGSGFGEDQNGEFLNYGTLLDNQSYADLKKEYPTIFLGTEGIRLDDFWLFGSAAGILAYYNENWFYPKKINQLLPMDIEFGKYGGRGINSLAVDPNGKIYAATDLGLLVYNSGSSDPSSFLINNDMEMDAIAYYNSNRLNDEKRALINDIPANSEAGQILSQLKENESMIQRVQIEKASAQNNQMVSMSGGKSYNSDSLTNIIVDLKRQQVDILLKLQEKEPGLYQAIKIPPLDLVASKDKMTEDECIVQYMPMSKKLFIQLISKEKLKMYEVDIDAETLMDTCVYVAKNFARNAKTRGVNVLFAPDADEHLEETLGFLYEMLLRPVENDIKKYKNVYCVPAKSMNYVPFGALINKKSRDKFNYAIEDFNIGYLSSMYLFNLIHDFKPSTSTKCVVFADPDFSLPGAKEEAIVIKDILGTDLVFTGKKASISNFEKNVKDSKILHLATHGHLDDKSLRNSWLLFSGDKKYNMADAFNLPLDQTDLVVLSACETALGGDGLEYATLARAFANSGARTVLGTLWEVDDLASKELMVHFYTNLSKGDNKFEALSKAKRTLINSGDDNLTDPSKWSPYIPIGKY